MFDVIRVERLHRTYMMVCRQYFNEAQVWGGLVVEVTQQLEKKLAWAQRMAMRKWWRAWWLQVLLILWWANGIVALKYNW